VAYDSAGTMTAWSLNTYKYDAVGMPWEVVASFQAGAPSRWTLRDLDGKVLRELKNNAGTWSVERDYVMRDGTPLAAVTPTGTTFLHPDHLGTPRLITNSNGVTLAFHVYYPFGEEATAVNMDAERMKFTGHERDLGILTSAADDLDYMHARFYNGQTGRFLSVDRSKASMQSDRPQSWDRFSYAFGNPLRYIDPDARNALDFANGLVNAIGSNVLLGGGRVNEGNLDYKAGQAVGDIASLFLGAGEAHGGLIAAGGALACEAGTIGGCTPVAAPVAAGGALVATHGIGMTITAAKNILDSGISFRGQSNDTGSSAGNVKKLTEAQLKEKGIDAEVVKQDLLGEKEAGHFDLGFDSNGSLTLFRSEASRSRQTST